MKEPINYFLHNSMRRSFSYVFKHLVHHPNRIVCTFEKRPKKYKFGVSNYGEIKSWINSADGDPWDVFAPGYKMNIEINKPVRIEKVIGIFLLENGNHKIAVRVKNIPITSSSFEKKQIQKYCKEYSNYTKINGTFVSLT